MTYKTYKDRNSFDQRKIECNSILQRHKDRFPVIVEKSQSSLFDIDKHKFLVPGETTIGQFLYILRKRIKLKQDESIYIFINNTMPPTAALMSKIYNEHKDQDGFLYVTFSGESTFG